MPITPKTINKTKKDALLFDSAQASVSETTGLSREELDYMSFEYGCSFAEWFASLFPENQELKIKNIFLTSPAKPGDPNNWYWMWWRLKWLQDDEAYVKNEVYTFMGYTQHKCYLLKSEALEMELLNMFNNKSKIFHHKSVNNDSDSK